jgi:hypothetical protein
MEFKDQAIFTLSMYSLSIRRNKAGTLDDRSSCVLIVCLGILLFGALLPIQTKHLRILTRSRFRILRSTSRACVFAGLASTTETESGSKRY